MTNQEIANTCFENLPKIIECWVTEDGHYHLHNAHGGVHFKKGVVVEEKLTNPKKKK